MVIDQAKIAQMEFELEEARAQLLKADGERFRIIMREISEDEKQRILSRLTERRERILFGLETPASTSDRPGKSGGDLVCDICGKAGLTKRGLALHKIRVHKGTGTSVEQPPSAEEREETGDLLEAGSGGASRRR